MAVKINFIVQFCHVFLQYLYLLIKGFTMHGQHFHSLIKGKVAFCPQFGIISKERTEGGLNKRASSCALLFSTLLVFPN